MGLAGLAEVFIVDGLLVLGIQIRLLRKALALAENLLLTGGFLAAVLVLNFFLDLLGRVLVFDLSL